jgi:hypothetical protein
MDREPMADTDQAIPTGTKLGSTPREVDRLIAGGAEASSGADIEGVPGNLLLFPSFVPHETVPPGEGAERISLAFDVTAAD